MKRYKGNPILKPIPSNPWESRAVFNPGIISLEGRVHLLYRAMGDDGVSRLGYASSPDGYTIEERFPNPVFEPSLPADRYGCEDPRLTPMDKRCIMTYTGLRDKVLYAHQISITQIGLEDLLHKRWRWGERWLPFPGVRNKDAVIFPRKIRNRYVMYHRIHPDICIAYSDDLHNWYDIKAVVEPRPGMWDCWKVGAATPPIEVSEGWLLIYHGVDFEKVYRIGTLLIDKENPEEIIYRSEDPILEPTEDYERFGNVPNVVFSCGATIMDGNLLLYYGGADTVIGVAIYDLGELIP